MFFVLSKILWALASPLNLIFLVLLAGVVLSAFSRPLGRSVFVLGMFMFIAAGILPVGENMLARLEDKYKSPEPLPAHIDGIVVLGGSFDMDVAQGRGLPALNDSAERLFTAIALARRYPQAILVFSGGSGKLLAREKTESEYMAMILASQQLAEDNVIYENESRNTYENILFTQNLILPQPGETWLLVTSAFHMPRAMAIAEKAGWTMVPYPVDYRTDGDIGWLPDGFHMLGNFEDLNVAIHEYIGLLAYQLTGKISLPLR